METIKKPEIKSHEGLPAQNPCFEIANMEVSRWVQERGLFENEAERPKAQNQCMNKFASRLYPNAGFVELLPVSKLILALFLVDDRADRLQGEGRGRYWKNLLSEIDNGKVEKDSFWLESIEFHFPVFHWGQNIASPVPAGKDIRNMVRNFIEAGIWEAENLLKNTPPLPVNYLKKLKDSSGAEIAIHYLTYIPANGIDYGILYSPELRQLRKTLILLICLSNDLASLGKEARTGDFHNLVLLYEIHPKLDRRGSIAKVEGKLEYLKEKYRIHQKQFLNNPGIGSDKKHAICRAFNGLLQGCETWAKEDTARYG